MTVDAMESMGDPTLSVEEDFKPKRGYYGGASTKRRRNYTGSFPAKVDAEDDDVAVTRLDSWMISLGEKTPTQITQDIEQFSALYIREFDTQKESLLQRFRSCIQELPFKSIIYAGFWSLINALNPTIGLALAETTWKSLADPKITRLQLRSVLRFLAASVRFEVITRDSFIKFLHNIPRESWDLIVTTLPYFEYGTDQPQLLDQLIGPEYIPITSPLITEKFRTIFEARIAQLQSGYTLSTFLKTASTSESPRYDIPEAALPPMASDPPLLALDASVFRGALMRKFGATTGREVPLSVAGDDEPERAAIEDIIHDTMSTFEVNPKECSRILLASIRATYSWFQPKITRANGTNKAPQDAPPPEAEEEPNPRPDDAIDVDDDEIVPKEEPDVKGEDVVMKAPKPEKKEEDIQALLFDQDTKSYNLEQMIVEAVFTELMRLPKPSYPPVFYHVILIQACRMAPNTFPSALGKAINIVFASMDEMDLEIIDRLADWFSHHLSNFEYFWMWNEWEYILDTDENEYSGQKYFVRVCLEKMIRLSYWDRIQGVLPPDFHQFLPPKPAPAQLPKLECEDNLFVQDIMTLIRRRKPFTELLDKLKDKPEELEVGDAIARVILEIGSKSFSHLLSAMERYLPVLQKVEMNFIDHASAYWDANRQFFVILVDKALNYRIVTPQQVKEWLLTNMRANIERSFVKDILGMVMERIDGPELIEFVTTLHGWSTPDEKGIANEWMGRHMRELLRRWAHRIGPKISELPESEYVTEAMRVQACFPNSLPQPQEIEMS